MRVTTIAGSLFLVLVVHSSSVSTQQAPSQPSKSGSIEGTVVQAGTGEPIAGARITYVRSIVTSPPGPSPASPPEAPAAGIPPPRNTLSSYTLSIPGGLPGNSPLVTTDSQGRFLIKDVEAGSYRLTAAANGYARQEYGQRAFTGLGTPIAVESGQTVKDITVQMMPAGTVSGRVTDPSGRPAVGVPVSVLRANYSPTGERTFQSVGSGRTNDRGEYRLYWITPGRYLLNAGSSAVAGAPGASPNEVQENYTPTFYPNADDPAQASPIEVQSGSELSNIDLTVNRTQLYRLRGRVIDAKTGSAPPTANVQIGIRTLTGSSSRQAQYNASDGTFELLNLSPGSYIIVATANSTASPFSVTPSSSPRAQIAVRVSDSDVDNLTLTLAGGVSIPGRIIVEGQELSTVPGLERMQVELNFVGAQVLTTALQQQAPRARLNVDGRFRHDDVSPGEYRVTVTPLPPDFYIKEARFDQTDVLSRPLRFSGSVPGLLDIVLSAKSGRIDGVIVSDQQQPTSGVRAVLIPARRDRLDLYKSALADQKGQFAIRGIPPGDYKLFAWEAIDQFGYFDPDLLRQSEGSGMPVQLGESSKHSIDVKLIPATVR